MSRQKVISSTKGPRGGFYLSQTDKQIPLRKIIHVIDGESRLSSCLLSLEDCNEDKPCPLHKSMYPLKTKLLESLENKTIVDLAKDVEDGNSYLPL